MTTILCFRRLPFLLMLFFASPAFAGEAELKALLDKPNRPTMSEILIAIDVPAQEGTPIRNLKLPAYAESYLKQAASGDALARSKEFDRWAKPIVYLERAFTGATWAPLGRDAVLVGDVLEAFYLALGQGGRVVRLNASSATIRGFEGEKEARLRLLESAGLDPRQKWRPRPWVGLDRTEYNPESQSTLLLKDFYDAYEQQGHDRYELFSQVNFVAFNRGALSAFSFFEDKLSSHLSQGELSHSNRGPQNLLSVPAKLWLDTHAWHDGFGALVKQPDGRFEAAPGKLSPLNTRKTILGEMLGLLQLASNDAFLFRVLDEAQIVNFEFPMSAQEVDYWVQFGRKKTQAGLAEKRRQAEAYWADRDKAWSQQIRDILNTPLPRKYPDESKIESLMTWFRVKLRHRREAQARLNAHDNQWPKNISELVVSLLQALQEESSLRRSPEYYDKAIQSLFELPEATSKEFQAVMRKLYETQETFRLRLRRNLTGASARSPGYDLFFSDMIVPDAFEHFEEDAIHRLRADLGQTRRSTAYAKAQVLLCIIERYEEINREILVKYQRPSVLARITVEYFEILLACLESEINQLKLNKKQIREEVKRIQQLMDDGVTRLIATDPRMLKTLPEALKPLYESSRLVRTTLRQSGYLKSMDGDFLAKISRDFKPSLRERCEDLFLGTNRY